MQKKLIKKREANAVDQRVGLRVRNRRLQLRLTQPDIGAALGHSFQQVLKDETGTNRVSASNLFRIAAVLGVDVAWMSDETVKAALCFSWLPPTTGSVMFTDVPL